MAMRVINVEEVAHSTRGASGAYRWSNCHGQPNAAAKLKPGEHKAGMEAALGTAAHELSALCLKDGTDAWQHIGAKIVSRDYTFEVDTEMSDSAQLYINFVRKKMDQFKDKGAILHVERPMSSFLDEDAYGTGDALIEVPNDRLIVIDFKNGVHVCVEPDSKQLKYYGYLALENASDGIDIEKYKVVELWIVQPRMSHPKGPIRRHITNPDALTEWFCGELLEDMAKTRDPNALLTVGPWCQFCPVLESGKCPAVKTEVANVDTSIDPEALTVEQINELMPKKKPFMTFWEKVEQRAFKLAMTGEKISGTKLVRKKANRIFKDKLRVKTEEGETVILDLETELDKKFGEDAYEEPKRKTPPNIEKLEGGRSFVAKWAMTPDTGLTLAALSDKREEVKRTVDQFVDSVDIENL